MRDKPLPLHKIPNHMDLNDWIGHEEGGNGLFLTKMKKYKYGPIELLTVK